MVLFPPRTSIMCAACETRLNTKNNVIVHCSSAQKGFLLKNSCHLDSAITNLAFSIVHVFRFPFYEPLSMQEEKCVIRCALARLLFVVAAAVSVLGRKRKTSGHISKCMVIDDYCSVR